MRLAFITILRRLLGPQFDFLVLGDNLRSDCFFFVNFNCRVLRGFYLISRRHRPNSGFPGNVRMDWTVCGWNSKGSSQLLDLHKGERLQNTAQLARNPALRKRLPQQGEKEVYQNQNVKQNWWPLSALYVIVERWRCGAAAAVGEERGQGLVRCALPWRAKLRKFILFLQAD